MRKCKRFICALVAAVGLAVPVQAALIIDVGTLELLPDTRNQLIHINVSGGDSVEGLNFFAQVADGGPALGGIDVGPKITAVNLITGTIFEPNNLGQFPVQSFPQAIAALTISDTPDPVIHGTGRLATLTIDTTGLDSGTWGLFLTDTVLGDTDFAGVPVSVFNGSLTVVPIPEPGLILGSLIPLIYLSGSRRRGKSTFCCQS